MNTEKITLIAAPMEGVTGFVFRSAHASCFGGADLYYSPFLSANGGHTFRKREIRDVLPENNRNLALVPQILGNRADDFLWAAGEMAALGYREVNLNLGCPSGTVARKGKGAGFLRDPEELNDFLAEITARLSDFSVPMRLSVKTRIGLADPDEGIRLMEVFNKYPISLLTIHPRTLRDGYTGPIHRDTFREMLSMSENPVCYNGDLRTPEDMERLLEEFPQREYPKLTALMAGRGLAARPSLFREFRGGAGADRRELEHFHGEVLGKYQSVIPEENNVLFKMKEFWSYLGEQFPDEKKALKKIKKARHLDEYQSACREIFKN